MEQIKIVIIEDNEEEAIVIEQSLIDHGFKVMGITSNLKEAYGLFYSIKPDVVLVDIYLNGEPDGIKFAETINENEMTKKPILFLTNSLDEGIFKKAMKTNPYSYLLKPFNGLELKYAIQLAMEKFTNEIGSLSLHSQNALFYNHFFFFKKGDSLFKIAISEVNYFSVEGRYIDVITSTEKFTIQWQIKKILTILPENMFQRIHRNHVVNMQKIKRINIADNTVYLEETTLPISRRFKQKLIEIFTILK